MLHPDIVLKNRSISGKGLFAKKKIPKGTILYRQKNDVREYTKSQYSQFSKRYRSILTKFANEENGKIFHHVDNAKYGNHSCQPNAHATSLGYAYMDIVLEDIECDEEITWDYGILFPSWKKPIKCTCGAKDCRGVIDRLASDSKIIIKLKLLTKRAERDVFKVKQPLVNEEELDEIIDITKTKIKSSHIFSKSVLIKSI